MSGRGTAWPDWRAGTGSEIEVLRARARRFRFACQGPEGEPLDPSAVCVLEKVADTGLGRVRCRVLAAHAHPDRPLAAGDAFLFMLDVGEDEWERLPTLEEARVQLSRWDGEGG